MAGLFKLWLPAKDYFFLMPSRPYKQRPSPSNSVRPKVLYESTEIETERDDKILHTATKSVERGTLECTSVSSTFDEFGFQERRRKCKVALNIFFSLIRQEKGRGNRKTAKREKAGNGGWWLSWEREKRCPENVYKSRRSLVLFFFFLAWPFPSLYKTAINLLFATLRGERKRIRLLRLLFILGGLHVFCQRSRFLPTENNFPVEESGQSAYPGGWR